MARLMEGLHSSRNGTQRRGECERASEGKATQRRAALRLAADAEESIATPNARKALPSRPVDNICA